MKNKFQIKMCPTCGSKKIRRVTRDVARIYKGQTYTVPRVEFYDCPNCGEKVYDREAMQKIESYSPAYRKSRTLTSARHRHLQTSSKTAPTSPA
jgi:YgiT-type zinc finger domain-containing protein